MEGIKKEHGEVIGEIVRKGYVITVVTLISRPLGYLREAIQAYLFGATFLVDAFVIAFNFPELLQTLFFSGATSAFLVPVCTRYLKDEREFSLVYSFFFNLCLILTLSLSLILLFLSDGLLNLIAPGFGPETKRIAKSLFIIMIPLIPLHALLSVIKAFLNAKEHFLSPELSGIIWNLTFIFSALFFSKSIGIYSLAIGATLGSFFQLLIQIPYLKRLNIRYSISLSLNHPSIKEAKRLFSGALIATSIVPLNSFLGRVIASFLPEGQVASLAYAFRLFILPFSLFAVPVYTVIFTKIAKFYHEKKREEIFTHIDGMIILLSITLIPSTALLCGGGDLFIRILYERGGFSSEHSYLTYKALIGYSVGLLFYGVSIAFVRIFNAFHNVKIPALVGIGSLFLNLILAFFLMKVLENLGISLSISLVSLFNFALLFFIFKKKEGYRSSNRVKREILRSILCSIILYLSLLFTKTLTLPFLLKVGLCLTITLLLHLLFFKRYYRDFKRLTF